MILILQFRNLVDASKNILSLNLTSAKQLTWWIHEVKVHKIINTQLFQLQHNRSQVGSKNLRVCVILR